MPSQQVEIAETIAAVKRALQPSRGAPSNLPITSASNRGNKLKTGAQHVHEGSLAYMHDSEAYRQKIEHAGYTRYILERNPRRYNEYGDELEDSESDEDADADAADENPYSGIRLEELLCPLKHPSELPTHPTMSHAYLSDALPDMIQATEEKLRQEKANLWRAKNLNRQLIGDEAWMPCGSVECVEDRDIFEPHNRTTDETPSKKRKRGNDNLRTKQAVTVDAKDHALASNGRRVKHDGLVTYSGAVILNGNSNHGADLIMKDATTEVDTLDVSAPVSQSRETIDGAAEPSQDAPLEGADKDTTHPQVRDKSHINEPPIETSEQPDTEGINAVSSEPTADAETTDPSTVEQPSGPPSNADESSPPPPSRRITRALAANNHSNSQSSAQSPLSSPTPTVSSSTSSLLQIDPLFLLPPSVHPLNPSAALYGLPVEEAIETRRLLTTYIQKQEESVRGYEAVLSKLFKAHRLREAVLEMCKAEGHVGEMSDGEDWIDYDEWGLQPGDLKKGRDEDEDAVEENTIGGRKGKRRARN